MEKILNQNKRSAFQALKDHCESRQTSKVEEELQSEREKRIVSEATLSALQVELREALERIQKLERKEERRIERRKKSIQRKRRDQVSNKNSSQNS